MPAPYEIAARLTLENKASAVLAVLSRDILNVEGGIKKLQTAFESLNRTSVALGGALATAFGVGLVAAMKKVADKGAELSNELAKMRNLNASMTDAEFSRLRSAAFGIHAQVPGATPLDATKILNTTYSLFGPDNAIKMLKPLTEWEQLLMATSTKGDRKAAEEKILSLVRSADLMGKFVEHINGVAIVNIDKLQHFLDFTSKVQQATHGRVGAPQMLALAQQGGPALSTMTDEGLATMAMVTQAMGGHRAGTALSSLFTQFKGGIMTKWRAQQLIDLGLLPKDAMQEVTPGGHIVWSKGALDTPFANALGKDPMAAVAMLSGAMTSHGITSMEDQIKMIFQIAQRQTSVRELHDILRNMPQMEQERGRILGAAGTGQALKTLNAESYARNIQLLDAAWQTLLQHVGGPLAQAAIPILQNLTAVIDKIAAAAQRNPEAVKGFGTAIAAIGAAFALAGIGTMMAAISPGGWFVGGMIALAGLNWNALRTGINSIEELSKAVADKLEKALKSAADAINGFADKIFSIGKKIWDFVTTLGGLLQKTSFGGGGGGDWTAGAGLTNASLGATGSKAHDLAIVSKAFEGSPYKNAALLTASTEGAGNYVGDHGTSFGPFQLHVGGGLGDQYPGNLHDASDAGKYAQSRWVRQWVERHGGFPSSIWHGLRHVHPNWRRSEGVQAYRGGHGEKGPVEAKLYLDGKLISSNVIGHVMKSAQLATQASHYDGTGLYIGGMGQLNTA